MDFSNMIYYLVDMVGQIWLEKFNFFFFLKYEKFNFWVLEIKYRREIWDYNYNRMKIKEIYIVREGL